MSLDSPIEYLQGVGPSRAQLLRSELEVHYFRDLLHHFPFRYIDRSRFHKIRDIRDDSTLVQLQATLDDVKEIKQKRGSRLEAWISDETGRMKLVWFQGVRWIRPQLQVGKQYLIFGKPNRFKGQFSLNHPEIQQMEEGKVPLLGELQPVYSSTEKLTSKGLDTRGLSKLMKNLLPEVLKEIKEVIPEEIVSDYRLMDRQLSYAQIHYPKKSELLKKARFRMKFEELFFLQMSLLLSKVARIKKTRGHVFTSVGDKFNTFYSEHLPFELTNAQKRVIKEIRRDVGSGQQMNRLLQGDVGSGKTIVGLLIMLLAIDNGFQAALMAPTEILANQHYKTLKQLLTGTGVRIGLLTGSTKQGMRKSLHQALEFGELNILIGTHALIEDKVKFQNLGMVIIDEQHRFGVAQRAKLWKKNSIPPHVLVMTATPIPRTLAMTYYGDLDVSQIDELPPGRKEIKTVHRNDGNRLRVFQFMEDEIKKGRQVYVVYPLIEESKKMDADLKDLMDGYESLSRRFPRPEYQIGIVHGRMKPEDKDYEMLRFATGDTHILVATTVIEVGVNVPNASVMVIESAERFGLSQLHQLRGRVGRGAEQSYCILMTGHKLSADARTRLETMVRTNDGFQIAEVDLELRGAGDIMGTRQSGEVALNIANLITDGPILGMAREAALRIIDEDPELQKDSNRIMIPELRKHMAQKSRWAKIS
ncbi:MAG: ATP-dependent DNA helicase RecG [Flavobacteriales bacterium]|nr:ATP-dependent DNA helicase RecG [Flavobacteriales bacterium]